MNKGKRVQIYIPADLVKKWDALPRYERSAEVAKALRQLWSLDGLTPELAPESEVTPSVTDDKRRHNP